MNDTELDQLLDQWKAPGPSPALRRNLRAAFPQPPRRRLFGMPVRWIVAFAAAAGLVAIGIGAGFNGSLGEGEGSVELPTGRLYVRAKYFVDPPVAALRWWWKGHSSSIGSAPDGALRGSNYFHDRSAHLFYGFEYLVQPLGGGQYKLTIDPLQKATTQKGPFVVTGEPAPLPLVPAPQIIEDGQPVDIDVFRSASERIYVHFQVSAIPFSGRVPATPPQPQPNHLHLTNAKIYKDGVLMASIEGDASGASIWVRFSGDGRYLITLDPTGNPSFVAAGQVNGNALEFQSGSTKYRLESVQPLASGSPRPIYVFHDSAFESQLKPGNTGTMVGSAGPACVFNGACLPH
jgi:hypothetical protein